MSVDNGGIVSPDSFEVQLETTTESTVEYWSTILQDHLTFGNRKISTTVGIFNMNSATDCPNLGTEHCQVPKDDCYAYRSEKTYPAVLPYRRRQELVWDSLDAETFADAFLSIVERRRTETTALRFNQSGDFRNRHDVLKAERIATRLAEEAISVYTYSASDYLEWSDTDHLVVNQSNDFDDFGDRLYTAVEGEDDIPDDGIHCPYQQSNGEYECGDCRLCLEEDAGDIYITKH